MIKDTNPDHYKVDDANFVEYMNDPKISGFGNWMFANGFNSGVWASTNWISVKDRLPKTEQKVIVSIKTSLGYRFTTIAAHIGYHERNSESDGWSLEDEIGWDEYDEENDWYWVPECWYEVNIVDDNPNWIIDKIDGEITHWMPLPEPPEKEK